MALALPVLSLAPIEFNGRLVLIPIPYWKVETDLKSGRLIFGFEDVSRGRLRGDVGDGFDPFSKQVVAILFEPDPVARHLSLRETKLWTSREDFRKSRYLF